MASLATTDAESTLAALVSDPALQQTQVVALRHEYGVDRSDEAALWVTVILPDDVLLGPPGGPHLDIRLHIRHVVEDRGWDKPVYTRFQRISEQLDLSQASTSS